MNIAAKLPDAVVQRARADGETAWLDALGGLLAEVARNWQLDIGTVLHGGSASLVVEVTDANGAPRVLKVGAPPADLATEARVFGIANGRGYAKLLAHDAERNALLLERLGVPLGRTGLPAERQIEVIAETLREAWVPLPAGHGLMTGAEKASWLAAFIERMWTRLGGPCAAATRDRAIEFAEERRAAHDPHAAVLVHGDAHERNALTIVDSQEIRCKFVDPDGLHAEPACDLAVPMRELNAALLADPVRLGRARCARLADITGVGERPIWQWGFMERVSTGLEVLRIGMHEQSRLMLAIADRLRGEACPE